jgi:hypothetical protein
MHVTNIYYSVTGQYTFVLYLSVLYFSTEITDRTEDDAPNNSSIVSRIRCSGNVFTEHLPSNVGGYKYRHTH